MSYSKDVFFKPWVGLDYPYGWFLAPNNALVRGDEHARGFKVMVLGLEHYCSIGHPKGKNAKENNIYKSTGYAAQSSLVRQCNMHNGGNTDCTHLFTCKDMTEGVIKEHVFADDEEAAKAMDVWWQPTAGKTFREEAIKASQKNFEQAFHGYNRKEIWNSLLFSNFFQRSMPYVEGNDDFHISTEKERACKAFADILKTHAPDIVWAWKIEEGAIFQSIKEKYSTLNNNKVTIDCLEQVNSKYKYKDPITDIFVPRLHILQNNEQIHNSKIYAVKSGANNLCQFCLKQNWEDCKKTKRKQRYIITKGDLPFLVLNYTDKNGNDHKTLMVFSYHPSAKNYFDVQLYSQYLKIIFKDYDKIVKWNCSPNLNNKYFSQNPRLTMIYGSNLSLLNP